MKTKATALAVLLLVMALIPAAVVGLTNSRNDVPAAQPDENTDRGVRFAASLCDDDFCDEAIRAMVILANTDYQEGIDFDDNSSKELYNRVSDIYHANRTSRIVSEEPVPYAKISNGKTLGDPQMPQLCPVASPWDCIDASADSSAQCVGISLKGVNYLCRQGYSAEEALLHYLPRYKIET